MIDRYQTSDMEAIWKLENKYQLWLKIELLVCEAWANLGRINKEDLKLLQNNCKVDINLMNEIEKNTKHDVIAFTTMLSSFLGPEKKWIHFGLTSTDVVDTAQNYQIKCSNILIEQELKALIDNLRIKAIKYKDLLTIARTHGIFAEPTSFGLKFVSWYEEFKRHLERLELARKQIEVVKISGAVGNFAHLELPIEDFVAKELGLNIDKISSQVTSRDRHAHLFGILANIATSIEKMAIEFRHLQRSEVNEVAEGFEVEQKGSSAMPHKKNPIGSENICGLARLIRAYPQIAYENNLLWHERDISHSSNERMMIQDSFSLLYYILKRMNKILINLVVNEDSIKENLKKTNNIFFSQRILLEIISKNQISREEAYEWIQKLANKCQTENFDFKTVILEDENLKQYFPDQQYLNKIFDINYFLRNVSLIYNRIFALD